MSERSGYLYLFYRDASGRTSCLFPNCLQRDNQIPAWKKVAVPAAQARFRLRVGPPYGREYLKAVVTLRPLAAVEVASLIRGDTTPLDREQVKAVFVELRDQPARWAEHGLAITTVDPNQTVRAPRPSRRVGVFISINEYASPQIRPLKACHKDAPALAEVMKQRCGLDEVIVLVNKQATLSNILKTLCQELPTRTQLGDTVILFWSGHGGRCGNENGTEKDGYDEYLVPYDGRLDNLECTRHTMLLDDTLGRWLQELDGRRVVIILDACHSAGQHAQGKGLDPIGLARSSGANPPEFLFHRLVKRLEAMKDLDQKELALLASSKASQISFERQEGDMSTMTYFLVELLRREEGPVTLTQAFEYVKVQVPAYVEKTYPGTTQTPVLVDQTTRPLYLRQP
jgi:hypothetical protein